MNRLLLGSGDWHWAGWVTVDANENNNPDYWCEFPPLPQPVVQQQWDEILASHVIEHLYIWHAKELIQTCYNILRPGGILTLDQPHLEYCCKVLAGVIDPPPGRDREQFGYWGIFGAPNGNPWDGHKAGYTPETLSDLVVEAGFNRANITISAGKYHEPIRDFTLTVVK